MMSGVIMPGYSITRRTFAFGSPTARNPPRRFSFFRTSATVSSAVELGMSNIMVSPGTMCLDHPNESAKPTTRSFSFLVCQWSRSRKTTMLFFSMNSRLAFNTGSSAASPPPPKPPPRPPGGGAGGGTPSRIPKNVGSWVTTRFSPVFDDCRRTSIVAIAVVAMPRTSVLGFACLEPIETRRGPIAAKTVLHLLHDVLRGGAGAP